ncbi:MAG: hypothetical protein DWQ07_25115 [Chloroflexi bacterium]|nr:MAG: hypothetical protein DWQ07_25115 [Chloroflexota bacterium]MBL1196184.1 hypothetical protein [Chloroflexota bacterium]NOH13477.1 hypothetical protein [Chloroflexota bacterium]
MVQTQIKCPQCGQPIVAEVEQILDTSVDPQAKAKILSGAFNVAQCPHCNFQGPLSTPFVYHDPTKELLLTYFPPELALPRDEQEKAIGSMINQVMENLPQEQRKGYLLNPQPVLTIKGLQERILEEDGVTKEMIEEQEQRVRLIQEMMDMDETALEARAKEEDENIDEQFFAILAQLAQATAGGGDEGGTRKLIDLQNKLLPLTTYGQKVQAQSQEIEAVVKELQELGENLTREKLLELVLDAKDNEVRLETLVGVARQGMDYQFFQQLSEKIDATEGDEKTDLGMLREKLLDMTRQIDEALQARLQVAKRNLDTLLDQPNIPEVVTQNLPAIDDYFLQVLNQELEMAQQAGDQEKLGKLQQVVETLNQASGGAELQLLDDLLKAEDEAAQDKLLEERKDEISDKFLETLTGLMVQMQNGDDQELSDKVRAIYRKALKLSMQTGMAG